MLKLPIREILTAKLIINKRNKKKLFWGDLGEGHSEIRALLMKIK